MRRGRHILLPCLLLVVSGCRACEEVAPPPRPGPRAMPKLWRTIPLARPDRDLTGYVSIGDLTGDGRPELLIHRHAAGVVPAYLAALDLDGRLLWEWGDESADAFSHLLRGAVVIYDLDGDGAAEVLGECLFEDRPNLCRFDGRTGRLVYHRPSPLLPEMRREIKNARGVPMLLVANLGGHPRRQDFILKYDASQSVPGRAWGLSTGFEVLWSYTGNLSHLPKVADLDGDGRDEFAAGDALIAADGRVLWTHRFAGDSHVDDVAIADLDGNPENGLEVLIASGCHVVRKDGSFVWALGPARVREGQRILARDFIASSPGLEIFLAHSSHQRKYHILDRTGQILTRIDNGGNYMDQPMPIRWLANGLWQLWLPGQSQIIDGQNRVVADLSRDPGVQTLHGHHYMFAQALAANVTGDEREELLLYFPYGGLEIRIYTPEPYDPAVSSPYVHKEDLINWTTYF